MNDEATNEGDHLDPLLEAQSWLKTHLVLHAQCQTTVDGTSHYFSGIYVICANFD